MNVTETKILALVGSLRAGSINRQIAELAADVAPEGVTVTLFETLADVPFYNEDLDPGVGTPVEEPAAVAALRTAASEADAALVVTPENNGTIPAVLKNAIDWLSRPFGDGALKGKPLAVVGGALGRYGGVWAHDDTRKAFGIAGARVLDEVKLSVPFGTLGGLPPAENAELTESVREVVGQLAAEVNAHAGAGVATEA